MATKTTKSGVDRWTSNGVGLKVVKTPITKKEAAAIDKSVNKKGNKK